jgi:2,3-bisphosphoglycerate-independent phosphoglycerate mutase
LDGKLQSLERIDKEIFKPVTEYLESTGEPFRVLVLPDHMTPVEIRTHSSEPVPFIMFDSQNRLPADETKVFSEACGKRGCYFDSGSALADWFFGN